jgi:hypothetical protein
MSQVYGCTAVEAFAQHAASGAPLAALALLGIGRACGLRLSRPAWFLGMTLPTAILAPLTREFKDVVLNLSWPMNLFSGLLLGSTHACFIGFPLLAAWSMFNLQRDPRPMTPRAFAVVALLLVLAMLTALMVNLDTCAVGAEG